MSPRRSALSGLCLTVLAACVAGTSPDRLDAQTPFTAVGLGYPVPADDARSAAMGGVGVALLGGTVSASNPADLSVLPGLLMNVTAAPEKVELDMGRDVEQSFGHTRFSMMRVVVPVGRDWTLSGAVKPLLDQDWEVLITDTLSVDGDKFPFRERRRSNGGTAAVELSGARRIGPLSLGLSAERVVGGVEQSFRRRFDVDTAGAGGGGDGAVPQNVRARGAWDYGGWRFRAGASVQLSDRARVGGVATWAGELDAEPRGPSERREFDLPASVELGASVQAAENVVVGVNGGWSGWSATDADLREGQALDTRWGGVGAELSGVRLGPASLRLRGGARVAELPFAPGGAEQATERGITLGVGAVAGPGRGRVDLSLEFGSRGDVDEVGLAEQYRRFTASFTLRP